MNYASIKKTDIANGVGVRVSLFVSGCTHHCKECFNPETWNFEYGNPFTKEVEEELLEALKPPHIKGLTLLGGEPLEPVNQRGLISFLRKVKERFPHKTIWCYTGYTLERDLWGEEALGKDSRNGKPGKESGEDEGKKSPGEDEGKKSPGKARCEVTEEFLGLLDILVDGEFMIEQKDIRLKFRGSSNQRILDMKKSMEERRAVLAEEFL